MRLLSKLDYPAMKFTVYFLGFEKAVNIPEDKEERNKWMFMQKATLELTQ